MVERPLDPKTNSWEPIGVSFGPDRGTWGLRPGTITNTVLGAWSRQPVFLGMHKSFASNLRTL